MSRLALVSGYLALHESKPHGTNHAGTQSFLSIAKAKHFRGIDLFIENAKALTRRGLSQFGIAIPQDLECEIFDTSDLPYACDKYHAVYSCGGGLMVNSNPYAMRPLDDALPVICEIDCSHSRTQWMNLFVSASNCWMREFDGLIFKSHATQRLFKDAWNNWSARYALQVPFPISIVSPNPIDSKANTRNREHSISTRQFLGISAEDIVFLTFNRIEPNSKGDMFSLLVQWRSIVRDCPRALLLISGTLDSQEYLARLYSLALQLGIANRIVIVPNPYDIWENARNSLMSASDVFLHISTGLEESAPLTILEAMSHSLPVICSEWSGMPEQIVEGVNGFSIPVHWTSAPKTFDMQLWGMESTMANRLCAQSTMVDAASLFNAIKTLHDNTLLRTEMGIHARAFIIQNRDPDKATMQRLEFVEYAKRESLQSGSLSRQSDSFLSLNALLSGLCPGGKLNPDTMLSLGDTNLEMARDYWIPTRFHALADQIYSQMRHEADIQMRQIVLSIVSNLGTSESEVRPDDDDDLVRHIYYVVGRLISAGTVRISDGNLVIRREIGP